MNYRPIGHMQKQFSSISETVQSSQNSSNSCTVQSLQYRFNTKLMSVRQIGHPRPSSRTRSAHVEQNRWCPHGTSAIREQLHSSVTSGQIWHETDVRSANRTSASLVTHAVGTRRAKSLMPTRHQRDPRVARCDQTHLAVVVVRLWCIDLTVGLAVDVDHISMISVVVVDVRAPTLWRRNCSRAGQRPCSSTDESQSRHHMDCSPAWVHAESRFHCTYQQ